jgi:hypothetical protein
VHSNSAQSPVFSAKFVVTCYKLKGVESSKFREGRGPKKKKKKKKRVNLLQSVTKGGVSEQ